MTDIEVQDTERVRTIRLNRPERRNAYDRQMAAEMTEAFKTAAGFEAVVLTGNGEAFCAGGFLANLEEADPLTVRSLFESSLNLVDAIRACPRPVIAAVDGPAAGGGNELVVACDFAIATDRATFGQTGPKVGSAPVLGATNLLPIQIGEKRAKEMAMMCRRYSAQEALEMGMVNEVVPKDQLETAVQKWLDEIHQLSPRYLEIVKISSNVWWNQASDNMRTGLGMLVQAIGSEDMLEGARAFLEKRKPNFRD